MMFPWFQGLAKERFFASTCRQVVSLCRGHPRRPANPRRLAAMACLAPRCCWWRTTSTSWKAWFAAPALAMHGPCRGDDQGSHRRTRRYRLDPRHCHRRPASGRWGPGFRDSHRSARPAWTRYSGLGGNGGSLGGNSRDGGRTRHRADAQAGETCPIARAAGAPPGMRTYPRGSIRAQTAQSE